MSDSKDYKTTDKFDRMLGGLHNLPDVTSTKPSTVVAVLPLIGQAQTYIIQTLRQREKGDTIFVQYVDDQGSVRLVIPPAAAEAIARQRDALTTKTRKRAAKEQAQARKARGEVPGFLKKRKK
jgi:ABC-type Na+ efflux pump permease subunit